jgi:hypothetical protein
MLLVLAFGLLSLSQKSKKIESLLLNSKQQYANEEIYNLMLARTTKYYRNGQN